MSTLFRRTAKIIASTYKNGLYPAICMKVQKKLLTDFKNTAIIHDVNSNGMWLSLVERLLWEQDAAGSSPVIPTIVVADSVSFAATFFKCHLSLAPSLLLSPQSFALRGPQLNKPTDFSPSALLFLRIALL